jgi:hypothetical protein
LACSSRGAKAAFRWESIDIDQGGSIREAGALVGHIHGLNYSRWRTGQSRWYRLSDHNACQHPSLPLGQRTSRSPAQPSPLSLSNQTVPTPHRTPIS